MRPFLRSAKVIPRGCSRPLQRAITDFAADVAFAQVPIKLQEHYGVTVAESTIQRIALGHAKTIFEKGQVSPVFPETAGRHKEIIAEMDGGMVPIVEPDAGQTDKRKGKKLSWKEAKISLAHAKGSTTPVYAGTIAGGPEVAGAQLLDCALRAGFGANSHVHAVGDGAPWIVDQVATQFGAQGSYLIDFYHVCEYLSAAAKAVSPAAVAKPSSAVVVRVRLFKMVLPCKRTGAARVNCGVPAKTLSALPLRPLSSKATVIADMNFRRRMTPESSFDQAQGCNFQDRNLLARI